MASEREYQQRLGQFAALLRTVSDRLGSGVIADPTQADGLVREVDEQLSRWETADSGIQAPADLGLATVAGVGPDAPRGPGAARRPQRARPYDQQRSAERRLAG